MKTNHTIKIVTNKMSQKKADALVEFIQVVLKGLGITAMISVDEPTERGEGRGVRDGDRKKV